MIIQNTVNHKLIPGKHYLADLLEVLDQIHSAASEDGLLFQSGADRRELIALLREIVFTAQETIHEVELSAAHIQFCLQILEKPSA